MLDGEKDVGGKEVNLGIICIKTVETLRVEEVARTEYIIEEMEE